jgi:hypothetical protein
LFTIPHFLTLWNSTRNLLRTSSYHAIDAIIDLAHAG